jgi:hypothetical protein
MSKRQLKKKNVIKLTKIDKKNALDYEINMFKDTYKRFKEFKASNGRNVLDKDFYQFYNDLLVESLALHTRILFDFFYSKKPRKDDLIAQDLLPENLLWEEKRPKQSEILKKARHKADKLLAHLTLERIKLKKSGEKSWNFDGIKREMDEIFKSFDNILKKSGRKIIIEDWKK